MIFIMTKISDIRYYLSFITTGQFMWTFRGLKTFKYYFIVLTNE